jgi:hypothetical protein
VNCRVGSVVRRGETVTVSQAIDPRLVARAVGTDGAVGEAPSVAVSAPPVGPAHEHIGCIRPGMGLRVRTALAAAGRARGLSTPVDDELARVRERLPELSTDDVTTESERRRVAETTTKTERLRERVAAARGELSAAGSEETADDDGPRQRLLSAITELSEVETTAAAARERLERRRQATRETRDALDRRLALEDRAGNLRRTARAHLVATLETTYADAVAAVPGADADEPFAAEPVVAALAVARVASPDAPVVVSCERFADAESARTWLDAPVIYIR